MQERPSFRLVRTNRFRRAYRKLDARYRELVKKALAQFVADPTYPSLRIKRIQGTDGIWSVRAGRDIRITFEIREDKEGTRAVVLRTVATTILLSATAGLTDLSPDRVALTSARFLLCARVQQSHKVRPRNDAASAQAYANQPGTSSIPDRFRFAKPCRQQRSSRLIPGTATSLDLLGGSMGHVSVAPGTMPKSQTTSCMMSSLVLHWGTRRNADGKREKET